MTNSMKQTVIKNPGWWKRRTSMERSLTLVTSIVVLVGVALCIALATVLISMRREQAPAILPAAATSNGQESTLAFGGITNVKYKLMPATQVALTGRSSSAGFPVTVHDDSSVCLTPGCIHIASKLLKDMNLKAEPCDDFYEFTCGNFIKDTNIPDDKSSVTAFSVISDQLQEQLRSMIEEEIKPDEPKPFVLAKKLYKACMNKTAIEKRGLEPMHEILAKLGGWPVLEGDRWTDGDFDWKESVYKFRKVGYSVDYFIDFSVGIDYKNSTKRIIDLDQAQLGLRREYLIKGVEDKLVKAYYDYMVDIAVIFGANRNVAKKELMDSLQFEIELANISLPLEKRRNATQLYNPMTIAEMQIKHPTIPWLEYLNKLLPSSIQVNSEEIVVNSVPSFISSVEKLLQVTPKRTLGNYVAWRAVTASISYLTEELRKRQLQYSFALSGRTEREARWKECIDVTAGSMSLSTGALYVRRYFNEESKKTALEMVQDIRIEFKEILENLDWMDDETKKSALQKAASMATHIGYPDELLDNKKLENFYEDLELNDNSYIDAILNLTLFSTNWSFNRLRKPVNKTDWVTHGRPAIVNAFYSSIENSIQFPAGILQGTFFSSDRPKYMNYGSIGFVIGHEITHGFDDQGRQFDKDGNLVDWWAPATKESFLKKAQCIIDQYGNYSVPEINMNLNGINTQGENIADNGGIKEAYKAYLKWVERNGEEQQLPGLPYTPQQMFWVSAANTWCSKYRPETLKLRVTTGFHSPGHFRVIGPMSNLEEFSNDFNCPLGSKMNPQQKCKVW